MTHGQLSNVYHLHQRKIKSTWLKFIKLHTQVSPNLIVYSALIRHWNMHGGRAPCIDAHVCLQWNGSFWQVLLFCQINITRLVIDLSSRVSYFGSYRELINVQMLSRRKLLHHLNHLLGQIIWQCHNPKTSSPIYFFIINTLDNCRSGYEDVERDSMGVFWCSKNEIEILIKIFWLWQTFYIFVGLLNVQ